MFDTLAAPWRRGLALVGVTAYLAAALRYALPLDASARAAGLWRRIRGHPDMPLSSAAAPGSVDVPGEGLKAKQQGGADVSGAAGLGKGAAEGDPVPGPAGALAE